MLVFFDVDTRKDFMNKDGAYYVPNAEEIKPDLKRLTQLAIKNKKLILKSADRHFDDDEELETHPPHCMNRREGQKTIPETKTTETVFEHKIAMFGKYMTYEYNEIVTLIKNLRTDSITFEKQAFDVFTNPVVEKVIEKLCVTKAIVYGVATEYCVKATVLGLLKRDIKVYLVTDAIQGIDESESKKAIQEMINKGAKLITIEKIEKAIKEKKKNEISNI